MIIPLHHPPQSFGKKILHGGVIEPTKTHPSDTQHRKGLKLDKSLRVTGSSPDFIRERIAVGAV